MFGLPKKISAGLKIDPLAVAIAIRPDLWPRILLRHKRIVARHVPIIIQTQGLAAERIQLLGDLSISRIASRNVEFSVGSESQSTSGMKLRRRNALNDDLSIDQPGRCVAIANHAHLLAVRVVSV